nr:anoctamin-9 isoform X3 [Ictidomys tridecemlineatus]
MGTCEAPEQWDFVLVAAHPTQKDPEQRQRLHRFLEELRGRGFDLKEREGQNRLFFGIRAHNSIFELYRTLLMEPHGPTPGVPLARPTSVPDTTRIRIVNFILSNMKTAAGDTFENLKKDGIFETRFPLHKGEEDLKKNWARWRNLARRQPIDDIRNYFGEKVALYFAWLGWYTYMLVPAALVGLLVFLSGFALFDASQISKEICEAQDILLCPLGHQSRSFQPLSSTCTFAKVTMMPSSPRCSHRVPGDLEAATSPRGLALGPVRVGRGPGGDGAPAHQLPPLPAPAAPALVPAQHRDPGPVCADDLPHDWHGPFAGGLPCAGRCPPRHTALLGEPGDHGCGGDRGPGALPDHRHHDQGRGRAGRGWWWWAATGRPSGTLLLQVNKRVALKLCEFEQPRTFLELERKFTIRFFILQFFAHFSSLVYIAFILGRINGHPGKSTRLAGLWKLEECHLSGCMMDLFVQMAIIMGLKQTLSNCMEYLHPWLAHKFRLMTACTRSHQPCDPQLQDWQRNYLLNPVTTFSLFDEFMEMMIQYGFTTIFVAAFPLAPLLALFSNLVEIRLDAIKMVWLQRRLVPRKAKDIGTWLQVLETIGVLAVIANGMVIAFTSEFIPRVVYKYRYGPCRQGNQSAEDCLKGYVNHSLSVFYTKDFQDPVETEGFENVTECRYRDYRNSQDYNFSEQFWFLLAIRLAFVILFEHVALCIKLIAAWYVPDVPQSVKNKVLEEKYRILRDKMGSSSKSTDV